MTDKPKTQSQKIRGILFRLWEQSHPQGLDFESYYKEQTDQIIAILQAKLEPPPPEEYNG